MRWKNEVAGGFTNSQNVNGNKENTLRELFVLAAQHGMHWVALGEYGGWNTTAGSPEDLNRLGSFTGAMAQSDGDTSPDLAPPATDLATAEGRARLLAQARPLWNALPDGALKRQLLAELARQGQLGSDDLYKALKDSHGTDYAAMAAAFEGVLNAS